MYSVEWEGSIPSSEMLPTRRRPFRLLSPRTGRCLVQSTKPWRTCCNKWLLTLPRRKELERAYSCVKEALKLCKELLGRDDIKSGDAHYSMGTILFGWSDYSDASKCFERARDIHKQKLGSTHLKVADSSYYLGCICERKGDYKPAAKHFEESLSGKTRAPR
ncbi:hypothetical protein ACHAXT_002468 [Thalassiosira profunda]